MPPNLRNHSSLRVVGNSTRQKPPQRQLHSYTADSRGLTATQQVPHTEAISSGTIPNVDGCNFCGTCTTVPHTEAISSGTIPNVDGCNFCGTCTTVPHTEAISGGPFPHVDDCNFCGKCIVDVPLPLELTHPVVGGQLPPKDNGFQDLLAPTDIELKAQKPNCTFCRGCNVELTLIHKEEVQFGGVTFSHGKGATNSWIFFATRPDSDKRFILKELVPKMWVAKELVPKMWVAKVSAVIPGLGYHIRWHAVWMEEARGITLAAIYEARAGNLMVNILKDKLNGTQVLMGSMMDLLTAQCDRHSENIFIDERGQLQFIDSDKSLGVIHKCGYDTMLIPGTRYHTVMRLAFW
eukprot:gene22695-29850_t